MVLKTVLKYQGTRNFPMRTNKRFVKVQRLVQNVLYNSGRRNTGGKKVIVGMWSEERRTN